MPVDVLAGLDDKQRKPESDFTSKKLLLESMLLLAKTKSGREVLRQKKLVRSRVFLALHASACLSDANQYPIIREMHRVDEAQMTESVTDTIGKLVEALQLPEGIAEKKGPKVEEIEEIV